jgi:AmmeMemoRadiSam system protein A
MSATDALGPALLIRARNAVGAVFGVPAVAAADHPRLHEPGASFVTLFTHSALRGCVGSLEANLPLHLDVASNACAAAFRDPRFAPLAHEELAHTRFEVSLVGPSSPIAAPSEFEAIAALVPHRDGVTLTWHGHRATLLPQVWESLPEPQAFLRALKHKAGLPANFWAADVRVERYAVAHYEEASKAMA